MKRCRSKGCSAQLETLVSMPGVVKGAGSVACAALRGQILSRRGLLVSCLLLFPLAAFAQMNTANITGSVKDPSGAVVPGVRITAVQSATQRTYFAVSNQDGEYLMAELPAGEYSLSVEARGFKRALAEGITLHAGDRLRKDFSLQVGGEQDAVMVEIPTGELQRESADVKDVIQNQQVVSLPLQGRQFLELSLLSEGVVSPPGGTRGDALQQTGNLVNILGQRSGHNLYLVDGTNVTDEYFNNLVVSPSVDAIQEFNLEKTDYNAEFGGKSGGVINVVTRSGSNRFHGSLFEFLRNDAFDARNYFDSASQPIPPFRQNQFGGTFGGPLKIPGFYDGQDKTFFFLNYEGQRIRDSLTHEFSVPTLAERAGNFSSDSTVIYDPLTRQSFLAETGVNAIPSNLLDRAALALLARLPPPNQPGTGLNLLAVGGQTIDTNQYNARLDHQFSAKDSAFLRASFFDAGEYDPFGSGILHEALLPGFGRNLTTHSFNLAFSETHTFTANVLNEFRFGWLNVSGGQSSPNAGNPFAQQQGILGTTTNPADMGYPLVSLSNGFTSIGDPAGFVSRVDSNYEFYDNVLIHHGNHVIQFGGYFFHLNFNPVSPNGARGLFTFNGKWTTASPTSTATNLNSLADFLLGDPAAAQVGIGEGAEHAHTNWAHFYLQDTWRVTPNLTLDAGLRYEFNQNLVDAYNQFSNIDLSVPGGRLVAASNGAGQINPSAAALLPLSPIPVVPSSSVGWNNSLLTPRALRLSPRLGLAWNVPYLPQTVVRAGFGIYTNQAAYSVLQNLAENLPFFLLKTVNANQSSAPVLTTQNILTSTLGSVGANGVNHDFRIEYNEVWNFAMQHALAANTTVEAQYVGSRTVHADSSTALNIPVPGPGTVQSRRPFPALNAFTAIRWDGWADFHALTLKLNRRFSHGLTFESNYTWSKSLDDASDPGTTNNEYNLPQNVYHLPAEKALSSFDHRQRFVASAVYDLPFSSRGNGWMRALVGGWQTGAIFAVQTGAPFTVNLPVGTDPANIGTVNGVNIERPNLVGDPNHGPQTPGAWFNTSAFAVPTPYTFGTAGRNAVDGPGYADLDLSLQKTVALREGLDLQLRGEAYNAFNHPNFDIPGRIFGSATFGQISSAENSREMQLAVKLIF